MTPTYDTHCPSCNVAITVWLEPDPCSISGYYLNGCCANACLLDHVTTWDAWARELEARSPAWWEDELERQQLARNGAAGLQPALL